MAEELEKALHELNEIFQDTGNLVRVVLSGRRRNMQTAHERIDIRPVRIKDEIQIQVSHSDGRQMTSKNHEVDTFNFTILLNSGYANAFIEYRTGSISLRITKKNEALIHRAIGSFEADLSHDRTKHRLLAASDPYFIEVGISDSKGILKPTMTDKYRQVEEFLRLMVPSLQSAISAGHVSAPTKERPLTITDLGCGHAYLTFAVHQYFKEQGTPIRVIGVDVREQSRKRNVEIAQRLGISSSIEFRAEEIADTTAPYSDVVIALHACDIATDDAIAWGVKNRAKLLLIAPCCHHDIQVQMNDIPEPWSLVTRSGIMKERLGDLITDALRMQILKMRGYRVEAIEFVGGEHTPRNLMIRAVLTAALPDNDELDRYQSMVALWNVKPALATLLDG